MRRHLRSICPHCLEPKRASTIESAHIPRCMDNPAVLRAIFAYLQETAVDGVCMASDDFAKNAPPTLPSRAYIQRKLGTWSDVATAAGLRPYTVAREDMASHGLRAVAALAEELHDGNYGPSAGEYILFSGESAPAQQTMCKIYGPWPNVVAAAGYTLGSRTYYRRRMKARSIDTEREIDLLKAADKQRRAEEISRALDGTWVRKTYYDWRRHRYINDAAVFVLR